MGYIEETNELKLDFQKIARMEGQEVIHQGTNFGIRARLRGMSLSCWRFW